MGIRCLSYLSQINLIVRLRVAQSILVAIRLSVASRCSYDFLNIHHVKPHFEVDTDAAVKWRFGVENIKIDDSAFDDLCEDLASLLVVTDPDLDPVTGVQLLPNDSWQVREHGWRELIESIPFMTM